MFNLVQISNTAEHLLKKIDLIQKGYDLTVINPLTNKPLYDLNPDLIIKQKLTKDDVKQLIILNQQKIVCYNEAEHTEDATKLRALAAECEMIEYQIQDILHFKRNKNYHRWFDFPKCTCNKLDNEQNIGSDIRFYNQCCIIHNTLV